MLSLKNTTIIPVWLSTSRTANTVDHRRRSASARHTLVIAVQALANQQRHRIVNAHLLCIIARWRVRSAFVWHHVVGMFGCWNHKKSPSFSLLPIRHTSINRISILTTTILNRTAHRIAKVNRRTAATDLRQAAQLDATIDAPTVRIDRQTGRVIPLGVTNALGTFVIGFDVAALHVFFAHIFAGRQCFGRIAADRLGATIVQIMLLDTIFGGLVECLVGTIDRGAFETRRIAHPDDDGWDEIIGGYWWCMTSDSHLTMTSDAASLVGQTGSQIVGFSFEHAFVFGILAEIRTLVAGGRDRMDWEKKPWITIMPFKNRQVNTIIKKHILEYYANKKSSHELCSINHKFMIHSTCSHDQTHTLHAHMCDNLVCGLRWRSDNMLTSQ